MSNDNKKHLRDLANGSNEAFNSLFHKYKDRIYSVALHMLKSEDLAEEQVQEVFMKVWLKRKLLSEINNFEAYLYTTTRNLVIDSLKLATKNNKLKTSGVVMETSENKTDFSIREQQMKELLDSITEKLPPQQKKIFILVKEHGLSHEKVAEQLNISPLTVKKHMSQALKFVRLHLGSIINTLVLLMIH